MPLTYNGQLYNESNWRWFFTLWTDSIQQSWTKVALHLQSPRWNREARNWGKRSSWNSYWADHPNTLPPHHFVLMELDDILNAKVNGDTLSNAPLLRSVQDSSKHGGFGEGTLDDNNQKSQSNGHPATLEDQTETPSGV